MDAILNLFYLCLIPAAQPRVLSEDSLTLSDSFSSDFVKQLSRIQIQKGRKVLLWNQVKSRIEACYSELIQRFLNYLTYLGPCLVKAVKERHLS